MPAANRLYLTSFRRFIASAAQSASFTLGTGITGLSGHAAWMIGNAIGTGLRLVGFNVDLFDAGNRLLASDFLVG